MDEPRRQRIVFVDDDPTEVDTFRRLYDSDDFEIIPIAATSVRRAVAALRQAVGGVAPDLFVLDLYFPDMESPPTQLSGDTLAHARQSLARLQSAAADAEALLMPDSPVPTDVVLKTAGDILYWTQRLVHEWCSMCGQAPHGGIRLLEALRAEYPLPRVMFYSRKAMVPDVAAALEAGALTVLQKPHRAVEVAESIRIRRLFIEYARPRR